MRFFDESAQYIAGESLRKDDGRKRGAIGVHSGESKRQWIGNVLLSVVLILCIHFVWTESSHAEGDRHGFGVNMGYGISFDTEDDIRFVSVLPHYRYRWISLGRRKSVGLDVSVILEGNVTFYLEPRRAEGLGVTPMLRLDLTNSCVVPFLAAGIGPYWFNLDVPELGQRFNFLSQGELGIFVPVSARVSAQAGYRIQHISNAGMSERNSGVDAHFIFLGATFHF